MTEAVRVIALCMGAALFSVSLRMHRPELAALFSLAVGLVALWMLREPFAEIVAASATDKSRTAKLLEKRGAVDCPYCGRKFVVRAGAKAAASRASAASIAVCRADSGGRPAAASPVPRSPVAITATTRPSAGRRAIA